MWWLIDDLQWADSSSRDVLGYLAGVVGPCQLVVTATIRTDRTWSPALTEFVGSFVRLPRVSRVRLQPLGSADVAAQVRQLTAQPVSRRLMERIIRLGDGIPFWTEELVLGRLGESGPVPGSVRELLEARLVRLDPTTRLVVDAVSVNGSASHQALSRVCGLDSEVVDVACDAAVQASVLVVTDDGVGYRFRHALLREAVAAALLPGRRQRLHRRWAEELDRDASGGRRQIDAARHWANAGDPTRAIEALYHAAQLAEHVAGQYERAGLLNEVLKLWPQVSDAEERIGVSRSQVALGCINAYSASSRYEECLAVIDDELQRPGDAVRLLYLRLRRHVATEGLALDDEDSDVLAGLEAAADDLLAADLDNAWLPSALTLCAYYLSDDNAMLAMSLSERALEAARANGNLDAEMLAVELMSWNLGNLGRMDAAIDVLADGLSRARAELPARASTLESSMAWYLWSQGRYAEAIAAARSALRYIRRPQAAVDRTAWITESLAESLISAGEWDEAQRRLDDAVSMPLAGQAAVTLHCLAGLLAVRRGDDERARAELVAAREHTPPQEDALLSQRVPPRWLAAELAAADGDLESARAWLAPLWQASHPEVVSETLWRPMLLLARLEADQAAVGGTERTSAEPTGVWTTLGSVAEQLHDLGPVTAAWRAQLAAERARATGIDDVDRWRAVEQRWAEVGQPPELAWARLRLARCLLAAGERTLAAALVADVSAVAASLGARPLQAQVQAVARRAGLDDESALPSQRSADDPRLASLTGRELEVLRLVARGANNATIARELFISVKTASVHVSHILAKLGVSSRTQAASLALRRGILDEADI